MCQRNPKNYWTIFSASWVLIIAKGRKYEQKPSGKFGDESRNQ